MREIEKIKENLNTVVSEEIDKGALPWAVVKLIKGGESVLTIRTGFSDIEKRKAVTENSIFRAYSMGKPLAAIALFQLMEAGKIVLNSPISDYLPEYKHMKVLTPDGTASAEKPILIKHLLNMTSGLVYPDEDQAGREMQDLFDDIEKSGNSLSTREVCRRIAEKPLAFRPGEAWRYGLSVDVAGAVIEIVSECSLSEYYKKYIFMPLEMEDTGFFVPKPKWKRYVPLYDYEPEAGLFITQKRHLGLTQGLEPPCFESAGAGILTTEKDFMHFIQCLLNQGKRNGIRLLGEKTFQYLCRNQLNDAQKGTIYFDHMAGYGYGSFMRMYMDPQEAGTYGCSHEFGWDGWSGPYFTVNLEDQTGILFLTQRCGYCNPELISKIRNICYSYDFH
ncbi:MAG: serine hydrolase domain-containing protein [Lachnospiraceae bacterium]